MVKQELIQRSPIRILEKSTHGGLKAGEIGIISSRKGVGKTAVLVQIAMDKLLQGKKVIHVSFSQQTDYVTAWYEDIFNEIAKKKNLEDAADVKLEMIKNRVLMNFNQDGISAEQILRSLKALIVDGGFKAEALIIDGYDFARTTTDSLSSIRAFAAELGLEIWYTCTVAGEAPHYDKKNIPVVLKDYQDLLDVIIVLDPKPDYIHFSVSKDHGSLNSDELSLKLDSKTLLIAEKSEK